MNRKKGLIVLLGILVLAGAFYAVATVLAGREQTSQPSDTEDVSVTAISKKASDVTGVTYRGKTVSYGIRPYGSGYVLSDDDTFPVDPAIGDGIASAVSSVTFSRRLTETGEPAEYGLDEPTAVVAASYADGTSLTLSIGDFSPYTQAYYAEIGDGSVYLLDGGFLSAFDYTVKDLLLDETVTPPKGGLASVTSIAFRFPDGGGFDLAPAEIPDEEGDGTVTVWRRTSADGVTDDADRSELVSKIYSELFDVTLDDWLDHYVVEEKLAEAGMDPAPVTITVRYTDAVVVSGEGTSTVTKDVELVSGFLIGDRLPAEDAETASPKRPFMLEGGTVLYVLEEADLSGILSAVAE